MKKAKSRLNHNKKIKKAIKIISISTALLWVVVFTLIYQMRSIRKSVVVQKTVFKEVERIVEVKIRTAKVTAYSCGGLETEAEILMNCPSLLRGTPRTANGTEPVPMVTMACDKANMGKTFDLEGIGKVTCTDTGGAINGAGRFDLYVHSVQEARSWGVKYIEYQEI